MSTAAMSLAKRHQSKLINDPVHGHITLDPDTLQFVDTPQFQRLRELKQLGCTYYVFPGASHNRFEHSIGTMHLACEMMTNIQRSQPELNITAEEIFLVKTAGLCHDLGHGPFSHVFDHQFMPRAKPGSTWHHEEASTMMLDSLIESNGIDIEPEAQRFLHELINPTDNAPSRRSDGRRFLFDVVANSRNSVDVDKFDYLQRDCMNVGMKSSYDPERLVKFSRVIDDEICFPAKEAFNLYELFHTRYSLFKQVYQHNVGKAIDFMICDALLEADHVLKISDAVNDPEEYLRLTDCVLKTIECSRDPALGKSQAIIRRLRKRQLYKLVDTILLPKAIDAKVRKLTAELLVSFAPAGCGLQLDDVLIDNMSINYALKEKNPVDGVHFFTSDRPDRKFKIPKEQVSNLIPDQFLERYIRIYLRDPEDVEKFDGAKAAVRQYLRVHTNGALTASPYSSTARPFGDAASSSSSSSSSSSDAAAMSGVTQARVFRLGRNFSGIIADSAASSPADARKKIKMSMNTSRSLSDQMSLPIVASFGSSSGSHGGLSLPAIAESTPTSASSASPPPLVPTGASSYSLPAHATSVVRAGERARAALLDEAGGAGSSPILPRKRQAAAAAAADTRADEDDAACDETDQESQDQ